MARIPKASHLMKRNFSLLAALLSLVAIVSGQNPVPPGAPAAAPQTEFQKWLADLDAPWQAAFRREVSDAYTAENDKLRGQYVVALEAGVTKAIDAGDLNATIVWRNEQQRFAEASGIPAQDDAADPPAVKQLRAAWRSQLPRIETDRATRAKALLAKYDQVLAQAQAQLTKGARIEDALLVKAKRDEVAAAWTTPAIAAAAENPRPATTPIASRSNPIRPPQVTIVSAFYGARKRTVDITKHLRKVFESGAASIKLDTTDGAEGRDPAPFERKETTIIYLINGERKKKTFAEGQGLIFKEELQ